MIYDTTGTPVTLYDTTGTSHFGAAPSEPGPPTEQLDPAALTELRHVVSHSAASRFSEDTPDGGVTLATRHHVRMPAKALGVRFGGLLATEQVKGRGWIIAYGANFPLTFNGQEVGEGQGYVLSDPLPDSLIVTPGMDIHVVWEAAPGSRVATSGFLDPGAYARRTPGTWDGERPIMADGNISLAPPQILGLTLPEAERTLSVGLIGDSFAQPGWGRRPLEQAGFAWADLSRWLEATPATREPLAPRLGETGHTGFDVIITAYGGNNSLDTLEAQHATHIAHWRWLAATGARVACTTLHPYTSSTDNWATTENQTITDREPARIARNDWLRDGAPLHADYTPAEIGATGVMRIGEQGHPLAYPAFDVADVCETSRNSGIWRTGWPVDGTHLHPSASDQIAPHLSAWVAAHLP